MDAARIHDRRWLTLSVLCVSLLVIVIDNTIVNVALPTLVARPRRRASATSSGSSTPTPWCSPGCCSPPGASATGSGARARLLIGLAVFGSASAAAAFSGGRRLRLIAARAVMGIGAALIMPATLSILTNVFTDARERALRDRPVVGRRRARGRPRSGHRRVPARALLVGLGLRRQRPHRDHRHRRRVACSCRTHATRTRPRIDVVGHGAVDRRPGCAGRRDHRGAQQRLDRPGDPRRLRDRARRARRVRVVGAPQSTNPCSTCASSPTRASPRPAPTSRWCSSRSSASSSWRPSTCSSCSGYSAFEAGVRTLPFALAMMVFAPTSSKIVQWFGTKRVVVTGMVVFAGGLARALRRRRSDPGYPRIMIAMRADGRRAWASRWRPLTESIMGSLPLHQAGVGSAVNDTSREVGGALGVAIIGSMLSSLYSSHLNDQLPRTVPASVRDAADQSVGAALQVSAQLGRRRRTVGRRGPGVVRVRDEPGVAGHRRGRAGRSARRLAVPAGACGRTPGSSVGRGRRARARSGRARVRGLSRAGRLRRAAASTSSCACCPSCASCP